MRQRITTATFVRQGVPPAPPPLNIKTPNGSNAPTPGQHYPCPYCGK